MKANATAIDSIIYRDIFSTLEMRSIWSDSERIQRYLDVEGALAKVQGRLKIIPKKAALEIARHCKAEEMDFEKLRSATAHIGYPVLPVVQQLTALCADGLGQWCHWGATTQDITDTATVMQMRLALALIKSDLVAIGDALAGLASTHKDTPMSGRSNLQQAVPMTFGYKAAVWLSGIDRHLNRLAELSPRVLTGEFGGAVGTLASLGDKGLAVQAALMTELDLNQPAIAWHTMRDTIAEAGCFLALVCGTLEKIALDIKVMMATELAEVQEPDNGGRGASSTMPQKRNPISCAYITACSSVVRQQSAALLNAMAADFERATGTWEIEWLVLPEIFCYTAGALYQARFLLTGLEVHPEAMQKNLELTNGLICTEAVMMALAPKIGRQKAHDLISDICQQVAAGKGSLPDLLLKESQITKALKKDKIEHLLDPKNYLGLSAAIVERLLTARN